MKQSVVKITVGVALLFVAEYLLFPRLNANEVIGLYLIVVAAHL